ncbi:unnamed protein product [Kluyveromyces dobzhanskii CBS 2104]|uniref:WGS project CCBQ000000000 data, contig 00016 n=1 Tax=Kluyveromyces dobzhanskii CBS 2104 TaxID=1427455 RepID=A0A0A8L096_9SACH|nr:unnamed protein product [Kluyveromyces dobzhanskii CBS 2104]
MRFGNVLARNASLWTYLKVTLSQLDAFDKLLLWVRLITSVGIIVFALVLTAFSAASPSSLYLGKLDTSSTNILEGLFEKLSTSVVSAKLSGINNGAGLTTSEILLLTRYVDSQVQNVPDYIKTGVYGWCSMKRDSEELWQPDGTWREVRNATTSTKCYREGAQYLLNYRQLLDDLGLRIVLSYAYGYTFENGVLDKNNTESLKYNKFMKSSTGTKNRMVNLIYAVSVIEFVILISIIIYYSLRNEPLQSKRCKILLHSISLMKLVAFICSLVAVIEFTILSITMRQKISDELESFGFSYHLGAGWFACLWIFAFLNIISCLVWTGFEWCITNNDTAAPSDDNTSTLGVHMISLLESQSRDDGKDLEITETTASPLKLTKTETNLTRYSKTQRLVEPSSFIF